MRPTPHSCHHPAPDRSLLRYLLIVQVRALGAHDRPAMESFPVRVSGGGGNSTGSLSDADCGDHPRPAQNSLSRNLARTWALKALIRSTFRSFRRRFWPRRKIWRPLPDPTNWVGTSSIACAAIGAEKWNSVQVRAPSARAPANFGLIDPQTVLVHVKNVESKTIESRFANFVNRPTSYHNS